MTIEWLDLSQRTYNRLRMLRITTLHQLALTLPRELLRLDGFGKKCLSEVASNLENFFAALPRSVLNRYANTFGHWRPYFSGTQRILDPAELDEAPAKSARPSVDPRASPQSQIPIASLPLSVRALNCMDRAGVTNVYDLAQRLPTDLLKLGNCGRRSVIEIAKLLEAYFDSMPPESLLFFHKTFSAWRRYFRDQASLNRPAIGLFAKRAERDGLTDAPTHVASVEELLTALMSNLGPKRSAIVSKRMGLSAGNQRRTLASIGREFGLTRERIRQIEKTALKLLGRIVNTARPELYPLITRQVQESGVSSLVEIGRLVPNLCDSGEFDSEASLRMLLAADSGRIRCLDSAGQTWTAEEGITPKFCADVLQAAANILNRTPLRVDDLVVQVATRIRRVEDSETRAIRGILRNSPHLLRIEQRPGQEVAVPLTQNLTDRRREFAYQYVYAQGVPVHISEILEAMQESEPALFPDSPSGKAAVNAMRALLERDDRFAWAGLSTWGLREWGYPRGVTSIGAAALELVRTAGRPLTKAEIVSALRQLYRVHVGSIGVALQSERGKTLNRDTEGRWHPIR